MPSDLYRIRRRLSGASNGVRETEQMPKVEYLIVGSGLTGSVIARLLMEAGRDVHVVDRRSHLGGNVFDHAHSSGIRVHTYGPHYFRTSSDRIWNFVTRFTPFWKYEPSVVSLVDGRLENWPIAGSYIRQHIAPDWKPEFEGVPTNFEEAALSLMPRLVYEKFVKEYNEKQWGVPAKTLSADLCRRFDVRHDDEPRFKPDSKYQGIPVGGYALFMETLLKGIPLTLDCDYLTNQKAFTSTKKLIFTGPIDAMYGYDLGKLKYRGQQRSHRFVESVDFVQPCGQVNNPQHFGGPSVRTLEWKHMMPPEEHAAIRGSVLTTETPYTPSDPGDYEYPFPDKTNAELYERYRRRAQSQNDLLVCGRLGEYKYFDMDQAIGRAMMLAEKLLAE